MTNLIALPASVALILFAALAVTVSWYGIICALEAHLAGQMRARSNEIGRVLLLWAIAAASTYIAWLML